MGKVEQEIAPDCASVILTPVARCLQGLYVGRVLLELIALSVSSICSSLPQFPSLQHQITGSDTTKRTREGLKAWSLKVDF